jgi:rod shape-determining protein MreC
MEWYQPAHRLESENKALRDLLNMKEDAALEFHSGAIIGDTQTQYSQTILVKIGQNDGIDKGQGALTHEGLIGRVIESGDTTSRILLLSDINSRIPVTVEGTQDRAILAGRNAGDPVLDHLPEDHGIMAGQKIITSGHGGVFPYGVPVGETYMTDNNEIAVRPFASADRSSHVQVVNYGLPAGSAHRNVASGSSSVLR